MMQAANFSLPDYLQRIDYQGACNADIETVTALMKHQLMHIPFENIDVLKRIEISMQPEKIVNKLIYQQRGGYCFELNGLFTQVLQTLDIPYQLIGARPVIPGEKKPRTHLALALQLNDETWLCDLGFGRYGIRKPINLKQINQIIEQDHDCFMLTQDEPGNYLLKTQIKGEWAEQYEFDLIDQQWIDFIPANHYTSTHPDSIFVNNLILVQYTETGRKIMNNYVLKLINNGQQDVQIINPPDMATVIKQEFNLSFEQMNPV
jgi:N-hydroxyarylamine O-acetyltransferase